MTAGKPAKRPAPFSLRLSSDEWQRLYAAANGAPLGTYVKGVLFADDASLPRVRVKAPVRDGEALAQLLARLGKSRIAANLNQLAHAANIGALDLDEATRIALIAACHDVKAMRVMLMRALGLQPERPVVELSTPREDFAASVARKRFAP